MKKFILALIGGCLISVAQARTPQEIMALLSRGGAVLVVVAGSEDADGGLSDRGCLQAAGIGRLLASYRVPLAWVAGMGTSVSAEAAERLAQGYGVEPSQFIASGVLDLGALNRSSSSSNSLWIVDRSVAAKGLEMMLGGSSYPGDPLLAHSELIVLSSQPGGLAFVDRIDVREMSALQREIRGTASK